VVDEVRTYRVEIERDAAGMWVASVPSVPGAHTQGRTIDQARRRIREALSLWVDDGDRAHLEFEVQLPVAMRTRVKRALELRKSAEATARQAADATERALVSLVDAGLSRRDAGELLGISRQRAQQIAETHMSAERRGTGGGRVAAKRAASRRRAS
jgi:predicted RNase H-like HicB family nuclease